MNEFGGFLLIVLGLCFYLIPSFISTKKRNWGSILALNILLGWSLIGWVVALVWALAKDTPAPAPQARDEDEDFYRWKYEQEKKGKLK